MLVLSRKEDQCIRINENIVIRVVQIRGDRVRIGIEAPRDVTVHREEVLQTLLQEKLKFVVSSSEESSHTIEALN
ncbi:MAG TPA: carbon storage regulator [Planctomycetaceae bacterium]|jgi:carbon storage regulator|nr:carbon storage regulator [Planctomycetaceae bacterium]HCP12925.1 carbon storage regulator [Planctomycetaceae bacterium]